MTRSLECEVYQTDLRQLRMGVPLFEPIPSNYDYVRPGDVGYVDKKGSFQRIFNVFNPMDSPVNRGCKLPEGFDPVPQDHQELSSSVPIPAGSLIAMNDVRSIGANASLNPWAGAPVPASMSFSISRSGSRSAGLYTRQSATCVDTVSDIHIKRYILGNYSSWFTLIHDKLGKDVRVQDIILVTGCHLTAEWAMGVLFWQTTSGSFDLGAGGPVGGLASASASASRNMSVQLPLRYGPDPDRIQSSLLLSQSGDGDPATASPKDQCIFIRGYYVKERLRLWPKAIKASADPEDLDMDKNADNAPSVLAVENNHDSDEEEYSSKGTDSDYHNLALDVILKFSHADVAIVHEYDVYALMDATDKNIGGISSLSKLQEVGPDIVVEFDSSLKLNVGSLKWNDTDHNSASLSVKGVGQSGSVLDVPARRLRSQLGSHTEPETEPSHTLVVNRNSEQMGSGSRTMWIPYSRGGRPVACQECRRHKTRCERELGQDGACRRCSTNGKECITVPLKKLR